MSDFSTYVDAVVTDLTTNVSTLNALGTDLRIHKYAPWSPEELEDDGSKHLAVWPMGDADLRPDPDMPPSTGHHVLRQNYSILYWEPAIGSSSRSADDQAGASALLDLQNAVRARFYVSANQIIGNVIRSWYEGTRLPERSSAVRWFQMQTGVSVGIAFT